jgi:hypothetical protein
MDLKNDLKNFLIKFTTSSSKKKRKKKSVFLSFNLRQKADAVFTNIKSYVGKESKKEVTFFKDSSYRLSIKPFYFKQGLAIILIFFVASVFIISQQPINPTLVVNSTIKQTSTIVAGGNPVTWSLLVNKSDITDQSYLAKLPKSAENIKISSVSSQQASELLQTGLQDQLSIVERVTLAYNRPEPLFFVASLFDSISKFLLGSIEDGVQELIEQVTDPEVQTTPDAVVVDLSTQVQEPETTVEVPSNDVETPIEETTSPTEQTPTSTETPAPTETPAESDDSVVRVDYETPAPIIEEQTTDQGKIVTVEDPIEDPQAPMVDVVASTKIPEIFKVGQEDKIKIKWKNEGDQEVTFHAYDTNGNGKLDYVEWTIPHLSEQIFEIIFISKAFQLDTDQTILADIYPETQTQDNTYASVTNGQYVRATFEQILDNTKDITLYAKPTDPNQSATVEVFPVYIDQDGNATQGSQLNLVPDGINPDFSNIDHEGKYRILLQNLTTPTDVFDLKVIGNIDFDWVVDPVGTIGHELDSTHPGDVSPYNTGLISLWHLNSNANDSKGTYNGTWTGTPTYTTGIGGTQAASFDVSNEIILDSVTPVSASMTYCFWVNASSNTNGGYHSLGHYVDDSIPLIMSYRENLIFLRDYPFTTQEAVSTNLYSGQWMHVCAVQTNTSLQEIYVNGSSVSTANLVNGISPFLHMGTDIEFLDDVAIWSRALDASEISSLYTAGLTNELDSTHPAPANPWDDVVSAWHLNSDATDSKGSNNGTWSGTSAYTTGIGGTNSGSFDGSSYISISNPTTLQFTTNDFSVSGWFKTTSDNGIILDERNAGVWNGYDCYISNGRFRAFIGEPNFTNYREVTTTATFNDGQWHNFVFVRQGSEITAVYIDGTNQEISTESVGTVTSVANTGDLVLGARADFLAPFTGAIDDVAIWDRALTAGEISALYYGANASEASNETVFLSPSASTFPLKTYSQTQYASMTSGGSELGNSNSLWDSNLISVWHLNSNATDSKGSNNGTWGGTPTYSTGIGSTNAASFDRSTRYIEITDWHGIQGANPVSISMWIKHPDAVHQDYEYMIWWGQNNSQEVISLSLTPAGKPYIYAFNDNALILAW